MFWVKTVAAEILFKVLTLFLAFLHCHLDKNMGLKVATNLILKMPSCIQFRDAIYRRVFGGGETSVYFLSIYCM